MTADSRYQATSYHVHSLWSDGADSVADLVGAATSLGLAEIGISDHLVMPPEGHERASWSLPGDRLADYVADVAAARAEAALPVRTGLEVDYFPEQVSVLTEVLRSHDFDYLIGSIHFVGNFPVDESERFWAALEVEQLNDVCRQYWGLVKQMAETGLFHVAGHIDLVKKFDFRATADLGREIGAALDAIAQAGMAVELNTSGWSKPCQEQYPSKALLGEAISRRIPILITADAHRKIDLDRDFDRAAKLLRELNVTETVRFSAGQAIKAVF